MRHLALTMFACLLATLPMSANAAGVPKIHPKKIDLQYAVVTNTRTVPAYAAALGASTNPVGELSCLGGEKIKSSSIFRVETTSRYFDLLKWCDGYGTPSPWGHWEHLRVGEKVVFRIVKEPVRLSISRCEQLGLFTKAQANAMYGQLGLFDPYNKTYMKHCTYSLSTAYIKTPNERWIYRIIDSGPLSQSKHRRVGVSYSASLPPPE